MRGAADVDRATFESTYRLRTEHEVEFGEIDMLQHVNNAVYVVWAETQRCVYVADVLRTDITGREGIIMARHDLIYDAPVAYRAKILIGQRVSRLGGKSLVFETAVFDAGAGRRAFLGHATCVAFDYGAGRSIEIPPAWRERIAAFEPLAPEDGRRADR